MTDEALIVVAASRSNTMCYCSLLRDAASTTIWLFVGSPDAGKRSAVIYTLLISARNHGVDPQAYLQDVIERLPGARPGELADHPAIKSERPQAA